VLSAKGSSLLYKVHMAGEPELFGAWGAVSASGEEVRVGAKPFPPRMTIQSSDVHRAQEVLFLSQYCQLLLPKK
jgi:hypothetical protein